MGSIPKQPLKELRVLDLCSNGRAAKGYLSYLPKTEGIVVKSYGINPKTYQGSTNAKLMVVDGKVPYCIRVGPESFEHVHFHMADGASFTEQDTRETFRRASRLLAEDGVLLFSADNYFYGYSDWMKKASDGGWEKKHAILDGILEENFRHIYRFSEDGAVSSIISSDSACFAGKFGFPCLSFTKESARGFFSLFSDWADHVWFGSGEKYFAIAVKK